jgi:hypothetical protein
VSTPGNDPDNLQHVGIIDRKGAGKTFNYTPPPAGFHRRTDAERDALRDRLAAVIERAATDYMSLYDDANDVDTSDMADNVVTDVLQVLREYGI